VLVGCFLGLLGAAAGTYSVWAELTIRRPDFLAVYDGASIAAQDLSATKSDPSPQSWAKVEKSMATLRESINRTETAEQRRDAELRQLAQVPQLHAPKKTQESHFESASLAGDFRP
jgi:hypothetical protein